MTYTVRNETGTMIMQVDNQVAKNIMFNVPGFFRTRNHEPSEMKKATFVISQDTVWETPLGNVYFWENTKLIPD